MDGAEVEPRFPFPPVAWLREKLGVFGGSDSIIREVLSSPPPPRRPE